MMGMCYTSPVKLESERAWRTYHGGRLIDELHKKANPCDSHFPEDWICSTVRAINAGREDVVEGLNRLAGDSMTLKDYIAADPASALGIGHVQSVGESLGVLVKLIDAAERLGIQCHPDREKAMEFFSSRFGKTECWHIVGTREIDGEKPCVYMGFKPGVTKEKWRDVFERQDIPAMLGMLHRIDVQIGDTFLIEGGTPHAIGSGCLLVEIQEPTDFTFRTERVTPQGFRISDAACHYGIGFGKMFECFHYEGFDEATTREMRMVSPETIERNSNFARTLIVGAPKTDCFNLEKHEIFTKRDFESGGGFSCLYVLSGSGRMHTADGVVDIEAGSQFFVPASAKGFSVVAGGGAKDSIVVYCAKTGNLRK